MKQISRTWSPDEAATVRRMARAGYSDAEIAAKLPGRTRPAVQALRHRLNIRTGISRALQAIISRLNLRRAG